MTPELKQLDRRRKREFRKHRRSEKWNHLNSKFEEKCNSAKGNFHKNMMKDLKISNPRQWYFKLKRMSSHDQHKGETVNVEELSELDDQQQADRIADQFERVSSQYYPLVDSDVTLPQIPEGSIPEIQIKDVHKALLRINTKTT